MVFELGTFSGLVEKTVLIWTTEDDDKEPSSILSVVINIPVLFEVNPKTSFWEQHGEGLAQVIELKINGPEPIHILEHGASNENFDYELKTIKEGFEYQLVVKPKGLKHSRFWHDQADDGLFDTALPQTNGICLCPQAGCPCPYSACHSLEVRASDLIDEAC